MREIDEFYLRMTPAQRREYILRCMASKRGKQCRGNDCPLSRFCEKGKGNG